jgi:hypothetical protein
MLEGVDLWRFSGIQTNGQGNVLSLGIMLGGF